MARKATDVYVYKIGPDYEIAHCYTPTDCIALSEWRGRSFAEFDRGMLAKGYLPADVNHYSLPHRGQFTEHTYSRLR